MVSEEIDPQYLKFWQSDKFKRGFVKKKPWSNALIGRFLLGIWLYTLREDGANSISLWSPKENLEAILKLYKNTKFKVRSLDAETDFFDIGTDIQLRDTLAPYQFIICLDCVLRTSIDLMKENGFTLEKASSKRYPAQTITYVDYADDIAILAYTPVQAESQLYSLENEAGCKDLHVNSNKTQYMCFNQNQTSAIPPNK